MENGHRNSEFSHKTWWFSIVKRWFTGGYSIFQWLRELANTVANYAQPPIVQKGRTHWHKVSQAFRRRFGAPPPKKKASARIIWVSEEFRGVPKDYKSHVGKPWKSNLGPGNLDHFGRFHRFFGITWIMWSQDLIFAAPCQHGSMLWS